MRERLRREVGDARAHAAEKLPAAVLWPVRDEILHLMEFDAFPRFLAWRAKQRTAGRPTYVLNDAGVFRSDNPIVLAREDVWQESQG